jgi:rhodanese-related sulfurtransferase
MQIRRIDPDEAKALLDAAEGWAYLDVRTEEEFRAGHVPGAVNVPVMVRNPAGPGLAPNPEFLACVESRFDKRAKLIVGCLRGPRSMRAAEILLAEGYTEVVDMRGGFDGELDPSGRCVFPGWARRGLPTTTD